MFSPFLYPVLVCNTFAYGYRIAKSARGFSLLDPDGNILSYGQGEGVWFDEYTLIGNHENIVRFLSKNGKTCLYDMLRCEFVTKPVFLSS